MARCKECIHYIVCAKEGRLVQIDEHTWDNYNQLDDVERFCVNHLAADVVPRAEVAREIFEEIYEDCFDQFGYIDYEKFAELKKKYTEEKE